MSSAPPPGGLGEHGEPCAFCGAPLAADQRYCLNCGERRAEAQLPFLEILAGIRSLKEGPVPAGVSVEATDDPPSASDRPPAPRWMAPLLAAAAIAALATMVAVGYSIGSGSDKQVAQQPVVVSGTGTAGGSAQNASTTSFKSDWPPNLDGWTVQVQALAKQGTDPAAVSAAKTAAKGKGATQVGALLSDDYPSLQPGSYIVYSGQYKSQEEARGALKGLQASFPDAQVVQVSASASGSGGSRAATKQDSGALSGKKAKATVSRNQLNDLKNTSPEQYSKRSAKLPDTTVVPGTPPPTDSQAPGGGSGGGVSIP